jgi:hypothetical protein
MPSQYSEKSKGSIEKFASGAHCSMQPLAGVSLQPPEKLRSPTMLQSTQSIVNCEFLYTISFSLVRATGLVYRYERMVLVISISMCCEASSEVLALLCMSKSFEDSVVLTLVATPKQARPSSRARIERGLHFHVLKMNSMW